MSAELAARRTAAAAVLGDWRREWNGYLGDPVAGRVPDYALWAPRLAAELGSVLQRLEAEASEAAPFLVAAQLAGVRVLLEAFDWETGDRQYALEQIDAIVSGDES